MQTHTISHPVSRLLNLQAVFSFRLHPVYKTLPLHRYTRTEPILVALDIFLIDKIQTVQWESTSISRCAYKRRHRVQTYYILHLDYIVCTFLI
jgi:hypothetical protein